MNSLVYLNGELVPEAQAKISIFDIGFMYSAVFMEALRTFRHQPYRLEDHLERMEKSLRYADLDSLISRDELREVVREVLSVNIERFEAENDCWICFQVTPGQGFPHPMTRSGEVKPTVMAYVSALPFDEYSRCYDEGKGAVISNVRNVPPSVLDQRGKTRFRLHYFFAKREAARRDDDAFALLLDTDGFVSEGTGANFFIVSDGALHTPTTRNILDGISRRVVIELAQKIGVPVFERDLTPYDLFNADEGFWTTSSYCLLPLSRVDGRPIGKAVPGPITQKLLTAWSKAVGVDIVAQAKKFAHQKSDVWRGSETQKS
jgi:branched-chain amino acid aminotransferase